MSKGNDRFAQVEKRVGVALLTLAILITFGSLAQRRQPQVAVAPTPSVPWPTSATEPYPGPYPPPASPIPTPIPTAVPTPMPTLPIAPNLGIIWAEATRITTEAGPNQPGPITFWRSNIADLASRASLLTISQGNTLKNASLSPDGRKIAFTLLSPDSGSRWWLHGTLWVMNVDGSGLRELALDIFPGGWLGPYPLWSPDSRTVAYLRSVPKVPPPTDKETEPDVQEIHVLDTVSGENRLLVADDLITRMLGWSRDGISLFYQRNTPGAGQELWAVKVDDQQPPERIALLHTGWGNVSMSPDGTKLIIYTQEEGLSLLTTQGIRKNLLPPSQPFFGLWSHDSMKIFGFLGNEFRLRALDAITGSIGDNLISQPIGDVMLAVSPDDQWIAVEGRARGELYLLQVGSTLRLDVPDTNTVISYFVGWIRQGSEVYK